MALAVQGTLNIRRTPLVLSSVVALALCGTTSCAQRSQSAPPSDPISRHGLVSEGPDATRSPGSSQSGQDIEEVNARNRDAKRGPHDLPEFGEYIYVSVLPEVISKTTPIYPIVAAHKRIAGTVMVHALVLVNGRVGATRVVGTIPELERAAVSCVKRWRFKPAENERGPVAVWATCPVTFKLE